MYNLIWTQFFTLHSELTSVAIFMCNKCFGEVVCGYPGLGESKTLIKRAMKGDGGGGGTNNVYTCKEM
jgi:hypothetical protein